MTKHGCVYLVGGGPGDPGLLTVRARQLLERADVVVYDHLISPRLLDWARREAERIYVGKQPGSHTLSQDQIGQLLIDRAGQGKCVVRLKGGDPIVFGRGGDEALALAAAGVPFEIVPGVTAAIGAAAYAGIALTHRGLASNVALVTGHEAPGKSVSDLDYDALAKWKGTLAFYMGVKNLPEICRRLIACGLDGQTPAAVIHWGTTPRQRVLAGAVETIADLARDAGIAPPAICLMGKVVALRDQLKWFETRPLFGKRIVVTRPRAQAGELIDRLTELGAEVIALPTIRIEAPDDPTPLAAAVDELERFDWIVLTSANAVTALFGALAAAEKDSRALAANRLCVIGPATAAHLAHFGVRADLLARQARHEAVVEALVEKADLTGAAILHPRADIAGGELAAQLTARGACVREVIAYRTVAESSGAQVAARLFSSEDPADRVDWVTFTSPSTVKGFFAMVAPALCRERSVRLASIGPSTTTALAELELAAAVEARSHTVEGLIEAVLDHHKQ